MRRVLALSASALAALLTVGAIAPSQASDDVTVHLDVDLVQAVPHADCDVTVPGGSNGIAVLDAAVTEGCISGYTTQDFGFGDYVDCIDEVCEQPAQSPTATWHVYLEDGTLAPVGVTELSFPTDGSTLRFSYEPWPIHTACFFLNVACPGTI